METLGTVENLPTKDVLLTHLASRPLTSSFGVGQCQIGSTVYVNDGVSWKIPRQAISNLPNTKLIVPSLNGTATYSQTGTVITVTATGHNMTAGLNGGSVYLAPSSGTTVAGWFTGFAFVDANTFTCNSTVSQTTSGNLTQLINELIVFQPALVTVPGGMLGAGASLIDSIDLSFGTGRTGGNRFLRVLVNGDISLANTLFNGQISASTIQTRQQPTARFRSALSFRTSNYAALANDNSNTAYDVTAFNFNNDVTLSVAVGFGGNAGGNDFICLESALVEVMS